MKRRIGPKGQVVIPKEIRESLGLKEGTTLVFSVDGEVVHMRQEPTADEILERFFTTKGVKLRRRVDWRSILDEAYKAPAGK